MYYSAGCSYFITPTVLSVLSTILSRSVSWPMDFFDAYCFSLVTFLFGDLVLDVLFVFGCSSSTPPLPHACRARHLFLLPLWRYDTESFRARYITLPRRLIPYLMPSFLRSAMLFLFPLLFGCYHSTHKYLVCYVVSMVFFHNRLL